MNKLLLLSLLLISSSVLASQFIIVNKNTKYDLNVTYRECDYAEGSEKNCLPPHIIAVPPKGYKILTNTIQARKGHNGNINISYASMTDVNKNIKLEAFPYIDEGSVVSAIMYSGGDKDWIYTTVFEDLEEYGLNILFPKSHISGKTLYPIENK